MVERELFDGINERCQWEEGTLFRIWQHQDLGDKCLPDNHENQTLVLSLFHKVTLSTYKMGMWDCNGLEGPVQRLQVLLSGSLHSTGGCHPY